jgi:hypothetical protein
MTKTAKKKSKYRDKNGKIKYPPDPVQGERIEKLEQIAPLWQYVARYLFAMSFAGLEGDEHDRVCRAVRAVDDGLIECGYSSGAFSAKDEADIRAAAEKVMAHLPKEL